MNENNSKKQYTYKVNCSFTLQFTFDEDDVEPDPDGNEEDRMPTEAALCALEQELYEHLFTDYAVDKVEAYADSENMISEFMNEFQLVTIYAKAWNTLNPEVIEPYLAEDVAYESQQVLSALVGKEEVFDYLKGKMQTIRKNLLQSDVYAEIGYCGNQEGYNVQVWSANQGKPCVLMAQGNPDEVLALVLLKTEEGKIKRVDICTIAPHPSTAIRTGEYPS